MTAALVVQSKDMFCCAVCGGSIVGEVVRKLRDERPVELHPACWETVLEARRKRQENELEKWKRQIEEHAAPGFERFRDWPWARVGDPAFNQRVRPKLRAFAAKYRLVQGSAVLCSDTGGGKTTAAIALVHNLKTMGIKETLESHPDGADPTRMSCRSMGTTLNMLRQLQWFTGSQIARARRMAPLGEGEAPEVTKAMDAGLLIVDEVGFEPLDTTLFDVIDHRYREELPTIVTTGLRPKEFEARYGSAMWRRLTERGVVVEDFVAQ